MIGQPVQVETNNFQFRFDKRAVMQKQVVLTVLTFMGKESQIVQRRLSNRSYTAVFYCSHLCKLLCWGREKLRSYFSELTVSSPAATVHY